MKSILPGCHAGGGNIVQRNAGLSKEELQRNNVLSSGQIYDLIYKGKGKMPGYGINCAPQVSLALLRYLLAALSTAFWARI